MDYSHLNNNQYACGKCYAAGILNFIIVSKDGIPFCTTHGNIAILPGNVYNMLNIEYIEKDGSMNSEVLQAMQNNPSVIQVGTIWSSNEIDQLTAAKVAAMKEMPHYASHDKNNQNKYNYTSFNAFINHCREHLLEHGLTITPSAYTITETQEVIEDPRGNKKYDAIHLHVQWKLSHISGQWESFIINSYCNNSDKGGKHISKAWSYAIKDMLRTVFLIPAGDSDPDDDDSKDVLRDQIAELAARLEIATEKATQAFRMLPPDKQKELREQAVKTNGN